MHAAVRSVSVVTLAVATSLSVGLGQAAAPSSGTLTAAAPNITAAIPTNGLIGHWPLDGNANDTSGQGNHGVVNGATAATGVLGGGYSFNGSASIDLPHFTFGPSGYTVSIWFSTTNPASANDYRDMFDQLDGNGGPFSLDLGVTSGGITRPEYLVWSSCCTTVLLFQQGLSLRDGRWHMLTGTYKSGEQQLFVDGAIMKSSKVTGSLPSNTVGAAIGGQSFGPFHSPWIGRLDEAVIYNRPLTKLEVLKLYQAIDPSPVS